jgi:hypothetical protein
LDFNDLITLEELRRLVAKYCLFIDQQRFNDLPALFTDDARLTSKYLRTEEARELGRTKTSGLSVELMTEQRAGGTLRPSSSVPGPTGGAEIAAFIRSQVGADLSTHQANCNYIDVDGPDRAHGTWEMNYLDGRELWFGYYEVQFSRVAGDWKIATISAARNIGLKFG